MNAQQAIEHALNELISQNRLFTNYDVTKYARSFTDENVKHSDVIAHVSVEMDDNTDYYITTTVVDKNQTRTTAVLYCPSSKYSYQYNPDAIQTDKSLKKATCCAGLPTCPTPLNPVTAAINAAKNAAATVKKFQHSQTSSGKSYTFFNPSSNVSVSNCTSSSSNTREVVIDNRGRVCIPKAFINRIGKKAGDVVYVQKSSIKGKLVISAIQWSHASCSALTTNQVDCYGNVRITPRSLNQCNVTKTTKNGSEFVTVRSESDHIVIE